MEGTIVEDSSSGNESSSSSDEILRSSISNETDTKTDSLDTNSASPSNEKYEIPITSKNGECVQEHELNVNAKPDSLCLLGTNWLDELQESSDKEPILMSKAEYVNQCDSISNCLDNLLTNEMTDLYFSVSHLFKSFRKLFISNLRLKNKVFQLNSQMQSVENHDAQFKLQISERDERIKYLEDSVNVNTNTMRMIEKVNYDLETELKELQRKYANLEGKSEEPERNLREERINLLNQYTAATDQIDILNLDLKSSETKQRKLEQNIEERKQVENELRQQIQLMEEELSMVSGKSDEANIALSDKNKEIQRLFEMTNSFQTDIQNLLLELETSKNESKDLTKDLKSCQKQLKEEIRNNTLLRKNLAARQFHLNMLQTQKKNLEETITENRDEIQRFKVQLNKTCRLKSDLDRKMCTLEKKFDYQLITVKEQNEDVSDQKKGLYTVKNVTYKDEEKDALRAEIRAKHKNLISTIQALKARTTELEMKDTLCRKLRIELEFFQRQNKELIPKIKPLQNENQKLSTQALQFETSISQLKRQVQHLQQQNDDKANEIPKLKQELLQEKDETRYYRNAEREKAKQLHYTEVRLREMIQFKQVFIKNTQRLTDKIRSSEDQVRNLQKEIILLKIKNKNVSCSLKQLEKRNIELNNDIQCKEKEHRYAIKSLEDKEHELEIHKGRIHSLTAEKATYELKINETMNELKNKNEKIELLKKDLSKIEAVFGQKEDEIGLLKTEIQDLRRTHFVREKQLQKTSILRKQLIKVHKLLEKEQFKCKAIEEATRKPINKHRWRMLKGTDLPEEYLILKNIHLQKQLVRKRDLLSKKENELRSKEKMIEDLLADKKKRTELNAEIKLWSCQKELSSCKREIKRLVAENSVLESVSVKLKNEINSLRDELRRLKLLKC